VFLVVIRDMLQPSTGRKRPMAGDLRWLSEKGYGAASLVMRNLLLLVLAAQQPVIRMYDDWRALAAAKGVHVADPAAQLPDADAAVRMFGEAGFENIQVSTPYLL